MASSGIEQHVDHWRIVDSKHARPFTLGLTTPQEPELHKSMLLLLARAWDYKVCPLSGSEGFIINRVEFGMHTVRIVDSDFRPTRVDPRTRRPAYRPKRWWTTHLLDLVQRPVKLPLSSCFGSVDNLCVVYPPPCHKRTTNRPEVSWAIYASCLTAEDRRFTGVDPRRSGSSPRLGEHGCDS